MMYEELYQYLLLHNKLPVPGIGTFLLEKFPARMEFSNKRINPPAYTISLTVETALPPSGFFKWLANSLQVGEREAVVSFNDFVFDMKKKVDNGDCINWNGVGAITRGLGGEVKFSSAVLSLSPETPVSAYKVIRENAEHLVRVGEEHKTSTEMAEMLSQSAVKKSYWWAFALAIALLAFVFIGWYFSVNGVNVSSTTNNQKVMLPGTTETYKILP